MMRTVCMHSIYTCTSLSLLWTPAYTEYTASGWEGKFCEADVDGCANFDCFMSVDCVDVPAPGVGAMCGPCPKGYRGDGSKCAGKLHPFYHTLGNLYNYVVAICTCMFNARVVHFEQYYGIYDVTIIIGTHYSLIPL